MLSKLLNIAKEPKWNPVTIECSERCKRRKKQWKRKTKGGIQINKDSFDDQIS